MSKSKKEKSDRPGSDELDKRLLELSSLFEISQTLNASLNLRSVLDNILLSPMGRMMINRGVILLHKEKDVFRIETLKGMPRELVGKRIEIGNLPQRPFLLDEIDKDEHDWFPFFEEFKIHLFLPIVLRNDTLGILAFGRKLLDRPYGEEEIEFLNSLVNIAATSIQNSLVFEELKHVNYRLDKKLQEMNTLLDVGKALSSTLDHDNIIKLLSYALMGQLMLNRYLIFVARDDEMSLAIQKGFEKESFDESFLTHLKGIVAPCLVEDAVALVDRWQDLDVSVVVPMRSQEKTKGVIALGSRMSKNTYQPEDLEFLTTLANQAMSSLENAWLFEDALEKKRLEEELAIARDIQQRLIPTVFPDLGRYDFHGINIPSKQVGGDYFDIIQIDDDRFGIAIADVSGKGTGASLIMSNVQASLQALIPEIEGLPELVGRVNNIIQKNTDYDKFVTFFYGVLNIADHSFSYVNAGHNPPFLLRANGTMELLEKGGLILGMMPNFLYETDTIELAPGDLLVLFTDGVTEAMDPEEEQFEEERLEKVIRENGKATAKELAEIIIKALGVFASGAPQSDDVTIVTLKVNKPE